MNILKKIKKRSAVSPVIATVILVAVAITVSVAVAYWMSGISGQYTSFEKVEIQSAYSTWDSATSTWTIEMKVKNSGTSDATLVEVYVNEKPVPLAYTDTTTDWVRCLEIDPTLTLPTSVLIVSGNSTTIHIEIEVDGTNTPPKHTLSSGTTVNVKLHSSNGMDYIKLVKL